MIINLDHVHTRNKNPVPVRHFIHKEVTTRMKKLCQLHSKGKKVVFQNIDRLEQIMLAELKDNAIEQISIKKRQFDLHFVFQETLSLF